MNEIQQYLAEEIASDCGQGYITRPEALRRLRVMGVSAAVALSLLAAACGGQDDQATQAVTSNEPGAGMASNPPGNAAAPAASPTPTATPSASPTPTNEGNPTPVVTPPAMQAGGTPAPVAMPGMPAATPPVAAPPGDPAAISGPGMGLPTEAITFNGPNGPLQGAFAAAPQPRGAVLVIHENRGLNDHIRTVVGRFAAAGFTAIGLDLLSEEGGTATFAPADVPSQFGIISGNTPNRFVQDMQACLDELQRRAPNAKIGAVGFCFGGGMIWQLIASKDPRLVAAAPFYGTPPNPADFSGSNAAVLAFYGELDTRVTSTRDTADAALTSAGLTHQMVTEPGANHAFFNDTGMAYNAAAATDAWSRVLSWFGEHLS